MLEALSSIHNLNGLSFEVEHDVAQTLILYKAHSVKYIDAMIGSIAPLREKKWTIVSYDRDFDKLGLLRAEPVDLLEK